MVEKVDRVEQTKEPHFGRCPRAIHDLTGVGLDGLDAAFCRVLLRVVWFRQFRFDAVLTEDIVPCRASLHLRVVIAEDVRNAMSRMKSWSAEGPSLSVRMPYTEVKWLVLPQKVAHR